MKIKTSKEEILKEYDDAQKYNINIDLYDTVQKNEDFFIGEQWKNVNAPDLDKPVINILKRVVLFFISSIMSDDISMRINEFNGTAANKPVFDMLCSQLGEIMEIAEIKPKLRDCIRNAAVDGDCCLHYYFDTENDLQNNMVKGIIQAEIIENTSVFFGNPQSTYVQSQPYILIAFRKSIDEVKEQAKNNADEITADDEKGVNKENESGKVTVIRKYFKQSGRVFYTDITKDVVLKPVTDTGYKRYPIEYMCWEKIKNSYHGQAAITGLIPNQIFINKLLAMAMEHIKRMAFPKVIYNKTLLPQGFSNRIGEAIASIGDPNMAVATGFKAPDMSNQVLIMLDKVINYTRDTMGASDASLGNIRPDNTSAIIATQKATSMPLELQKMDFYRFVEGSVRIWINMMSAKYGSRMVSINKIDETTGEVTPTQELFDFSALSNFNLKLNVDIGASTYWSELMQVQTMDNLFTRQIITDPILYLESIPPAYIPNKSGIIDAVKKQQAQNAQINQLQQSLGNLSVQGGM